MDFPLETGKPVTVALAPVSTAKVLSTSNDWLSRSILLAVPRLVALEVLLMKFATAATAESAVGVALALLVTMTADSPLFVGAIVQVAGPV